MKTINELLDWIEPVNRYAQRIKDSGTRQMFREMHEKLQEIQKEQSLTNLTQQAQELNMGYKEEDNE